MSFWRLASLLSGLVGARIGGAIFGVLTQLVLARSFSAADVGEFFLVMSVTAIVSLIITGGYPALAVTLLARYHTLGRQSLSEAFHRASWRDTFWLTAITACAVGLIVGFADLSNEARAALVYGGLAALPYAVMRLNSASANSQRRFTLSYVPDFIYRALILLVFVVAGLLIYPDLPIEAVIIAYVAITVVITIYQARALGDDAASAHIRARGRDLRKFLRNRAMALLFVAIVTVAFADIVTLIAGYFLSTADIAVLGVSIKLAALIGFVTQSSQQFVIRDLTAAMARGTPAEVDQLLFRVNVLAFGVMTAAIGGSLLLGDLVLGIFGEVYKAGYWPLILFLISQMLRAAAGMNAHMLSLKGFQVKTATSCAIAMAIFVAATAILAPRFGLMGIAIAVVITDCVWALHLSALAGRLTGRRADIVALALRRFRTG
jgi:O-antigen/teichoic acid export membrane protein